MRERGRNGEGKKGGMRERGNERRGDGEKGGMRERRMRKRGRKGG